MSKYSSGALRRLGAILLATSSWLIAVDGHAQQVRVVVLPKMTVDGAVSEESPFESAAIGALTEKGLRVVELKAALGAQKLAFSESVLAGRVPQELTVLGADMIFSAHLNCTKASDGILDSQIKAYFCVLSAKFVRVDSGDVVMGESRDWTVHGLNSQMAVQHLIKGGLQVTLGEMVKKAMAAWGGAVGWSLDLVITGLDGKKSADAAVASISGLNGVTGARLVVFNKDYAQLAVTGREAAALAGFAGQLESDNGPQLKVTYFSGRVIHAEADLSRKFRTAAAVFVEASPAGAGHTRETAMIGNALEFFRPFIANLEYLNVVRLERVSASAQRADSRRAGVLAELGRQGVAVALFASMDKAGQSGWNCVFEAVSVTDGGELARAEASSAAPDEAIGAAVRLFDSEYRKALSRPGIPEKLGIVPAPGISSAPAVAIDTLRVDQVFPALLPHYRTSGIGLVSIRNTGVKPVEEGEARFSVRRQVISTVKFGKIPAGGSTALKIGLDTLPEGTGETLQYLQLSAVVSFRVGEAWGREDAYAPLMIHQALSMDWAEPRSIASFVDPSDPLVRALAEKALSAAPARPAGFFTPALADAVVIFSSLWHRPLRYVGDPADTSLGSGIDSVRSPAEMLHGLSGDCDDLTVLYASLCESVGVATAVMVLPGHVLLGVDSGALAGGEVLFGLPRSMFVEVDGALFVPVETTAIGDSFAAAWLRGAAAVRASGKDVLAFRTREAWRTFPHSAWKGAGTVLAPIAPDPGVISATLAKAAGGAPEKAQPWSKGLAALLSGNSGASGRKDPKAPPLASALIEWMTGNSAGGAGRVSELCASGTPEACYDLFVMAAGDAAPGTATSAGAEMLPEIMAALPPNVASMLLDRAGTGAGADALEDTPLRKRLREALIRAQETMQKKKGQGKKTGVMLVNPVGGRKGAPLADPAPIAAQLFWDAVYERR